jgi:hypothetical protein
MASVPGGGSFLNPLFQVVSFGAGTALGPVLRPVLQDLANLTWEAHTVRPFGPELAAALVAAGIWTPGQATQEGAFTGFSSGRMDDLTKHALKYPDTAELLELWRRGRLTAGEVGLALQRAGIPDLYRAAVLDLFTGRLDPAIIATAIQRGIMQDPGILPVGPPTGTGKVARFPVSPLDTLAEAKAHGIDLERLFVETAIVGLPASPDLAARATYRNIIERVDFDRAIAEGNTRNEWGDAIFNAFREILTANQYAELELRGFLTQAERRAETAKWGMSQRDSDLLFDVLGRSVNVHQIVTGEARGGVYKPPPDTLAQQSAGIPPAFLASLQRGNLRPEYYDLAYANRYTYPSFFAIRALLQAGVLTADAGHQILLEMGWKPSLARLVADHYGRTTTAASDPHVAKAQVQLWGTTHRSYIAGEASDAEATGALVAAGVASTATGEVLTLWQHERSLIRKQLTPAQIKKAYAKLSKNYATGVAWTRDDALAALVERGYSVTEANDFLDIP